MSSTFEKDGQLETSLFRTSFRRVILICQFWAELKVLWSTSYKSLSWIHGCPLYWIALIAGSFLFLTQFMSSHRLHLLLAILSIFSLKNFCFVFLTIPLNFFQLFKLLECQYASRSLWQLLSYQALECLVILTFLEYLCHRSLMFTAKELMVFSRALILRIESVLRFFMEFFNSVINQSSFLLFLMRICFDNWTCSLTIGIMTEMSTWLEESLQSGWIWWVLNSIDSGWRKTKSRTELESWLLSEYLVGKFLVGLEVLS